MLFTSNVKNVDKGYRPNSHIPTKNVHTRLFRLTIFYLKYFIFKRMNGLNVFGRFPYIVLNCTI